MKKEREYEEEREEEREEFVKTESKRYGYGHNQAWHVWFFSFHGNIFPSIRANIFQTLSQRN